MKTWLEYINEEAAKYGLTVGPLVTADGQFFGFGIARNGGSIITAQSLKEEDAPLNFKTREAAEAFILGVWWARSGE